MKPPHEEVAKKRYNQPHLHVYGDISTITRTATVLGKVADGAKVGKDKT